MKKWLITTALLALSMNACAQVSSAYSQAPNHYKYPPIGPEFYLTGNGKKPDPVAEKRNKATLSECRKQAARDAKTDMGVRVLVSECQQDYDNRKAEYER